MSLLLRVLKPTNSKWIECSSLTRNLYKFFKETTANSSSFQRVNMLPNFCWKNKQFG